MNEKILEELGLTKGEITVYLTLLKLGETTTGKIIKDAQISSGKIYEILDKLMDKGLASYIIKEKTKYFSAASPNRILDYVHEKEKALKLKEEQLKKELPSLLAVSAKGKKAHETRLFRGLKGIQTAIHEALDELTDQDNVLAMGVISKREKYNKLWRDWHRKRIQREIACKILFSEKGTPYFKQIEKLKLTQVRILEGITPSAIDVIGEKVLIFTYGDESSCLVVKNPEIAQSFTTFFHTLWEVSLLKKIDR